MNTENFNIMEDSDFSVTKNKKGDESINLTGQYIVYCLDQDGNIKWTENIDNLVTLVGRNDILDRYFTGSSYTATWYMGLVDGASTPTYDSGDTMSSHAGWTENTSYSNATRPTTSWGASSSNTKATTATAFTINASANIAGCFIANTSTKGATTGLLYSCGSFSAGTRAVQSGDTLSVTYTAVS